ncbi:hypothetical protein HD806DRAFT_420257 [Xylariaceae sp. AK1471]|nr:hypothetical protein HD806DRAFT_420257 [Xylariaceae sp. AK1471]
MATQPLFGLLPAGQPLITAPTLQPNPTSFLYLIPNTAPKPFAHLAVFLLPSISLPESTAAAIYLAQNPSAFAPGGAGSAAANFKFLGGVGPGKESAVFKLGGNTSNANTTGAGAEGVVIGIDIEDAASVGERIQQQQQQQSQSQSTALVTKGAGSGSAESSQILVLAQRIIQNAFNFLSSFSGQVGGPAGVEVVPLKAFQEWWRKFEAKIKRDPSFLERDQD